MVVGPPFCSSRFVAMVFLNAIVGDVLHVFACFYNISFVFCIVLHVCAFVRCALPLWHALSHAWCMVLACMSCITSSSCVHHHVHHVDH